MINKTHNKKVKSKMRSQSILSQVVERRSRLRTLHRRVISVSCVYVLTLPVLTGSFLGRSGGWPLLVGLSLPPIYLLSLFLGFQHSQEILSGPPKLVLFWNGEPWIGKPGVYPESQGMGPKLQNP